MPHHRTQEKLAGHTRPVKVADQLPAGSAAARFNAWFAVKVTTGVGTMWCAYAFAAIALISLPQAIKSHDAVTLVSWVSQTFLQLVLLSVIIVGQNVLAARPTRGPRRPTTTPTPCSTKPSRSRSTSRHKTRCSAISSTRCRPCPADQRLWPVAGRLRSCGRSAQKAPRHGDVLEYEVVFGWLHHDQAHELTAVLCDPRVASRDHSGVLIGAGRAPRGGRSSCKSCRGVTSREPPWPGQAR